MERDLAKIRQLAEEKRDENWKFRPFLKGFCRLSLEKVDRLAHKLYREISSVIDCGECGNCCREIKPVLNRSDIERLVKGLNISTTQFKEE